jgi:hypothetical protein
MARKKSVEIVVPMAIDVDGAPNAYGPDDRLALDYELNAHVGAKPTGRVVGYLTRNNDGKTPIVQGAGDPFPGFYISTSGYEDKNNEWPEDPRRYVNAAEINYTLLATVAKIGGVQLGDFCVVHSLITRFTVYAIVGDSGNSQGTEGSLALFQRLGYDVRDGKSGGEGNRKLSSVILRRRILSNSSSFSSRIWRRERAHSISTSTFPVFIPAILANSSSMLLLIPERYCTRSVRSLLFHSGKGRERRVIPAILSNSTAMMRDRSSSFSDGCVNSVSRNRVHAVRNHWRLMVISETVPRGR